MPVSAQVEVRAIQAAHVLFPKPLEPVSQFRAPLFLVCELGDEQRERLGVSGDP
jgi:hypothetical protein